jgi:signal transduction histidine kinase
MHKRIFQQIGQQKLFIGNASHEMQTPLAICRNRLEMLMEDETLTEKQLSELMKTHRTLENLTRLNKSLLLLCKIENRQFTDVKSLCLNELLLQYLDDYKEVYAYRHVQVEVHVEECFRLEMSESLAIVLLTNLLKNAFVHVTEGGVISLSFTASSFRISNTGDASLDKNRIFERFYKEGKAEGSTGLGLAKLDSDLFSKSYDVIFTNGEKIEFDKSGDWTEVKCKSGVPTQIVPSAIRTYVKNNYPDASIIQIERKRNEYEVKLSNRWEITFDSQMRVIDIDD